MVCLLALLLIFSLAAIVTSVEAKPTLNLNFYKDNGYGMGSDMNGEWTINTDVSSDVQYVEFYLDGQLQLNDSSTPYSWNFNTGSYSEGQHTIKVVAYDAAGRVSYSRETIKLCRVPLNVCCRNNRACGCCSDWRIRVYTL